MSSSARLGGWSAATAILYLVLARAAVDWNGDFVPGPLWLATGAATALALACPHDSRPAVILGTVVGAVTAGLVVYDDTPRTLMTPVAGNLVQLLIVMWSCDRLLPAGPSIRRTRHALLVMAITLVACVVSGAVAVADTASTVVSGRWESWWRWVLGDAIGLLLTLPIALFWEARLITSPRGRKLTELVLTLLGIVSITAVSMVVDTPLLFTTVPLVMWLAIRFGPRITAPLTLVLAITVTTVSGHGAGPFESFGGDAVVQAQLFTLSIALSSLVGGAHALRAWRDHNRLAGLLAAVPDVVLVRDEDGEIVDTWVPPGRHAAVRELAPDAPGAPPIVDDDPLPVEIPVLVTTPAGSVFERRTAQAREDRRVEFYRDVTAEQQAFKDLRRREEALEDAPTAEQARIAKEIHDSPLQLLAAAKMRVETVGAELADDGLVQLLTSAADLIGQSLGELRGQIHALTPADVTAGEVVPALEHLARQVLDPSVEVTTQQAVDRLGGEVSTVLFQVGREAIANVAKHARPAPRRDRPHRDR